MKSRSPGKNNPCFIGEDKLKIIIRIRPILNQQDYEQFVQLQDDNTLQIKRPGICTYMKFNNILPPNSNQKDLFHLVEDSIKQFLNGINMTIFAYGQTGAGKTYSMIGNYSHKDSQENLFNFLKSPQRGILSRSLEMIMSFLHKNKGNRVFVSFFEIYNQKIFDLYNNNMVPLDIRQSKNGEISIPQLMSIQVFNMEQSIQFLMAGLKNRATGSTHGNAQSSRSHSIFHINLERQNQNGQITYSSLRIVDLAGSQKFKIPSDLSPGQKQIRIQQLTSINGSLSCLGHCISALIQKSRTHIPFRNSKLTRILSDSLLGQGKMRFIICISPSFSAHAETFSTLQFANRAKKAIFQRSQMRTPGLSKKKSSQNQQMATLRRELERQKQIRIQLQTQLKNILVERPQGILKQNTYLRKQNQKLKQQIKQLMMKKEVHKFAVLQNNTKWQDLSPKNSNKQTITGEDLKQQMLKLPIFQNKKSLQLLEKVENKISEVKSNRQGVKNKQLKQNVVQYNKKRAQFQKKIKKFIESDSPSKNSRGNHNILTPNSYKNINQSKYKQQLNGRQPNITNRASPSFNNNTNINKEHQKKNNISQAHGQSLWRDKQNNFDDYYQSSQIHMQSQFNMNLNQKNKFNKNNLVQLHSNENNSGNNNQNDSQWIQNEDTQQLIQQACQKMNLPDFRDLKCQMDRAKQQLILLKQKDDEISRRKHVNSKF